MSNPTNMDDKKNEIDHINNVHDHTNSSINDAEKQPHLLLRTEGDNQTILSALWTYRKTALICMMAAFSASLDGYQGGFFFANTTTISPIFECSCPSRHSSIDFEQQVT